MTSLLARIRRAFLGEKPEEARGGWAALRGSRPLGYGLIGPQKGPFDDPPAEPVELDPDALPWELREGPEDPDDPERGP